LAGTVLVALGDQVVVGAGADLDEEVAPDHLIGRQPGQLGLGLVVTEHAAVPVHHDQAEAEVVDDVERGRLQGVQQPRVRERPNPGQGGLRCWLPCFPAIAHVLRSIRFS
jgi:hypothetical protein